MCPRVGLGLRIENPTHLADMTKAPSPSWTRKGLNLHNTANSGEGEEFENIELYSLAKLN